MNVIDAAYNMVHDYPGGASSLAPRISGNLSPAVLNSKVDPKKDSHHLRLDEAVKAMALTGDYRVLHAICDELGFVAVEMPTTDETSNEFSLFKHSIESGRLQGDLMQVLQESLENGEISEGEVGNFNQVIYSQLRHLQSFKRVFSSLQTPSRPKTPTAGKRKGAST